MGEAGILLGFGKAEVFVFDIPFFEEFRNVLAIELHDAWLSGFLLRALDYVQELESNSQSRDR